mmetsp:Transcript_28196/g.62792  ORF Transcript_28196/g.62792 Transcript_28196/m.62792 type:complete len:249 (-) Transcript_28196:81-827(-)
MSVAVGGKHLEHTVVDRQQGDIEGTSAQIKDQNVGLAPRLVHSVRDSSGRGLVDDALHLHAGNRTGILGGLTLSVVEVGGDGNDGIVDVLTEEGLGGRLHLCQDHGGDLLGGELGSGAVLRHLDHGLVLVANNVVRDELLIGLDGLVGEVAADQTLNVEDGVGGVDGGLVLGGIADQTVAVVHKGDVRGSDAVTLIVGHDLDAAILEHTDARVRRTEINTDRRADGIGLVGERGGSEREGQGGQGSNC